MKQFYLEIITPEGSAFEGEALRLTVNTTEGPVCIMAGHIDFFAVLEVGVAKVVTENESFKAACSGGVISVTDGRVSVAAITFERADSIDVARASRAKQEAERIIAERQDRDSVDRARIRLARAMSRLRAADKQ